MESAYNKSTRLIDYSVHDKVWIRNKTFKTGESAKLAPRRSGPWEVVEVKPNGRNFQLKNCRNGKLIVVHHDRMEPIRSGSDTFVETETSDDESSSSDDGYTTPATEPPAEQQGRYPRRERTQRDLPGTIPWDAIRL